MEQAQPESGAAEQPLSAISQMAARQRLAAQAQAKALNDGLRTAFGRMVQGWPGLDAQVRALDDSTISLAELSELLEPAMFVSLLEGQGEQMAVSLICPKLLAGMVEGVATGRVFSAPPDTPRAPTRTDAALIAPLIDALMHQLRHRCGALLGKLVSGGWVYGSHLVDPRPLPLMLEDGEFRLFRFHITLGQDKVQGSWTLLLPDTSAAELRASPTHSKQAPATRSWSEQMNATLQASPVDLRVVLYRAQLSLDDALSLKAGDTLCLPMATIEGMSVEALDGRMLAAGRLGQARGQRAVRLMTDLGAELSSDQQSLPKSTSLTPILLQAQPELHVAKPSPSALE